MSEDSRAYYRRPDQLAETLERMRMHVRAGRAGMARMLGRACHVTEAEIEAIIADPDGPPPWQAAGREDEPDDGAAEPPRAGQPGAAKGATKGATKGAAKAAKAEGDREGWTLAKDPVKPLAADCPVTPLGTRDGRYLFLDGHGQLRDLSTKDFSGPGLRSLFDGQIDWLWAHFPKFSMQSGIQNGWQVDRAGESLMAACAARGVIDLADLVRGPGAWKGDDGGLVLHAGDAIWFAGDWRRPGRHGRHVYTAGAPCPRPLDGPAAGAGPAEDLLALLDRFRWRAEGGAEAPAAIRPFGHALQSTLVLGWTGLAMVGGALDWRPMLWITGEAGSGKSTLFRALSATIGDLVEAANATAAGIWTRLGASTRAVAIEEAENSPNSNNATRLIELARQAASGGLILRGSADHQSTAFTARSAFVFNSIVVPPMQGQDESRFAVLELTPAEGAGALKIDGAALAAAGAALRGRIRAAWPRWPDWLEEWRATLAARGLSARDCDQFGGLLAMADLLLADAPLPGEQRAEIAALFAPAMQRESNADRMLNHLRTTPLHVFRGGRAWTVEELIRHAAQRIEPGETPLSEAASALGAHGVHVYAEAGDYRVALPNQHEALRRLYEGSVWRSDPGSMGGWAQAMRRLPGARQENSRRIGGRGWSVPVAVALGE